MMQPYRTVAHQALEAALPIFKRHFGQVKLSLKSDGSSVSQADLSISRCLTEVLLKAYPQDKVLSEENLPKEPFSFKANQRVWVIDPIDGTDNYAAAWPHCGISIGLFEGRLPRFGLIYENSLKVILENDAAGNLRVNHTIFRPTRVPEDPTCLALLFPLKGPQFKVASTFLQNKRVRSLGSVVSHATYLALGKVDASLGFKTKIWDVAAAFPILKAAKRHCAFLEEVPACLEDPTQNVPFVAGSEKFCQSLRENLLNC